MSGFGHFTPEEQSELDTLRSRPAGEFTTDDESRFEALVTKAERSARIEAIRNTPTPTLPGDPNFTRSPGDIDTSKASRGELRDAALRVVEAEGRSLASHQLDHVDSLLRGHGPGADASVIAKMVIASENDAYRSTFQKSITTPNPYFTAEEAAAMAEYRAANEGTGSAGWFRYPRAYRSFHHFDSGAVDAPVVDISRVVTITTDAWKGVSSQGTSSAYQAESAVVADGTPTLAQPVIPVYAARGFIPYTIEVGQDYPGFAEEISTLLGQGYIDLLANNTVVGSGASQPRGIFTAVSANTTSPGSRHRDHGGNDRRRFAQKDVGGTPRAVPESGDVALLPRSRCADPRPRQQPCPFRLHGEHSGRQHACLVRTTGQNQ